MSRGDLPGLAVLALTLRDLLRTLPDLQTALEMTVQVFDALRHKGPAERAAHSPPAAALIH